MSSWRLSWTAQSQFIVWGLADEGDGLSRYRCQYVIKQICKRSNYRMSADTKPETEERMTGREKKVASRDLALQGISLKATGRDERYIWVTTAF